jgi:hypothetical protein
MQQRMLAQRALVIRLNRWGGAEAERKTSEVPADH